MENKLAKLYNEIGTKIVSAIPVKWEKIYYLGEITKEKSSWSSVFYYTEENSSQYIESNDIPEKYKVPKTIYEKLMDEINEILLEIYDCFIENGQQPWEQLSLYIDQTGDFSINYLYDTISCGNRGPMEREIIWAYETFGNVPPEGTYLRKILDKYVGQKGKRPL